MVKSQDLENISNELFRRKILISLLLPVIFVSILWVIFFFEYQFEISLTTLGIYPLSFRGLPGIIFSPFIHNDLSHLFNNSLPLLVLGTALFYFYPDVSLRVIGWSWVITGTLVWLLGREAWHIGASGIVYSLASFLFVSGLIRRYFRLMAVSLLVVYLYGSMVWGMFPFVNMGISWEAHMLGAVLGVALAIWLRHEGPQRPEPEWLDEPEEFDIP
ncbi:MAG: rhomboid family intramembrane serine protease [Bacteroidales bacterium]|nr:rhomboid family intramembrane serine protease [Bacteroidales bacterium]